MRVRLTPPARADLKAIWKYLAVNASPRTADRTLASIELSFRGLSDFPFSGSPRDEIWLGLRAVFYASYVTYYRVRSDVVAIMRVVHGAQDAMALDGLDPPP